MKILIVGAGIGGLTLAALLNNKEGFNIDIVEKSKKLTNIGFSIGIWANGRFVLNELGIEKELRKKGSITERYQLLNRKGDVLVDYDVKKHFSKYWPAEIQVKRDDLYYVLLKKCKNIPIKTGITVEKIIQLEKSAKVIFTDHTEKEYDLIVGSDGIHSIVRKLVFKNSKVIDLGLKGYWMWIPKQKRFPKACVLEMISPKEFFGIYPHGDNKICAYFITDKELSDNGKDINTSEIESRFPSIFKMFPKLRVYAKKTELTYVEYPSRVYLDKWYSGNIVLLGDAAHAFENFAGIGGTMAMEDAYVLAQELLNRNSLSVALKIYQQRRKPRVDMAAKSASRLRKWKIFSSEIEMRIRNFILPFIPYSYFTKEYEKLMDEKL